MEGDRMKMRGALLLVGDALDTISAHEDDIEFVRTWIRQTKDAVQEALSAPPRQCDVGTAEEQEMRFSDYCRKHYDLTFDLDSDPCKACPFFAMPSECRFAWAQMPYAADEGGAE